MPAMPPPDARAALLAVAHDLSNALAVALGRLQLAERHGSTDRVRSGQDLSACAAAIRRSAVLLEDLTRRASLFIPATPGDAGAAGLPGDRPSPEGEQVTMPKADDARKTGGEAGPMTETSSRRKP